MSGNLRSFARVVNFTMNRLHGKRTVASSDWEDSWHYPLQSVDALEYFCVAYIIYGCPELPRLVPLGLHFSPQVALSIQEKIL